MALFKNKEEKQQAHKNKVEMILAKNGITDLEPETLNALYHNGSTKALWNLSNASAVLTKSNFEQATIINDSSLVEQNWILMKQNDTLQKQNKKQIEQHDKIISLLEKIAEK